LHTVAKIHQQNVKGSNKKYEIRKNCAQNYWASGLCPSSRILNPIKHNISEMDLLPSTGEGRETPTLMGPLERANINHWTSD
jgi:hypothetical protein